MTCARDFLKLTVITATMLLAWPFDKPAACHANTNTSFQRAENKQRATALVEEGVAALNRNETEAAKSSFSRALQQEPNNELARTYLGIIADRGGNLAEAERHFHAAASGSPASP